MAKHLATMLCWGFTALLAIGIFWAVDNCNADPIRCPADLESSLRNAFKTCSEELQKMELKPLLGLGNISINLLKEAPLVERVVALTEEVDSEELHDETKVKRSLLNVSLLKEAGPKEVSLHRTTMSSRKKRESELEKEVGELVVCAVEKLMKEQPVLQQAIEECNPGSGKDDEASQQAFEECIGARLRQMCPNLKLN